MTETTTIRMDRENYYFLTWFSEEENRDLSKALRELVYKGRPMLAGERYKKGEASLDKTPQLAGAPVGQMVAILADYRVKSNLEKEDYLKGLENLRKLW